MVDTHILQDADIPFAERLHLREYSLAWISRDVGGIRSFIFPKKVVDELQLTPAQVESSLRKILEEFCFASTPLGKESLNRVLVCEHTSQLRHCVLRLRRNELTYQDAVQYAIVLESLWDSVNTEMSDATWARCSFHFDTALISLRIVYLILYLRQEFPSNTHETAVRASVFNKVYKSFFNSAAPTDDKFDKHSTHFKNLLAAWRGEFDLYAADNFEDKLRSLEHHHGNVKTADILDQFIRQVQVNDGWMLRAYQLEAEYSAGKLYRRTGRRRSSGTETAGLPAPQPVEDLDELSFDEEEDNEGDKDDGDADYDYKSAMANSAGNSDDEGARAHRPHRISRPRPSGSRKSPRISRGTARPKRSQLTSRPRRSGIRYIKDGHGDGDDYVLPVRPSKRRAVDSRKKDQERTVTILREVGDSPILYGDDDDEPVVYDRDQNDAVRRALAADARAATFGDTWDRNSDVIDGDGDLTRNQSSYPTRKGRSGGREQKTLASVPRRSGLRIKEGASEGDEGAYDDVTYHPDLPGDEDLNEILEDDGVDGEQVLRALESPEGQLRIRRRIDLS